MDIQYGDWTVNQVARIEIGEQECHGICWWYSGHHEDLSSRITSVRSVLVMQWDWNGHQ